MNYLEFLEIQKKNKKGKDFLLESFKNSQLGKARDLILKVLKKDTNENIISLGNYDLKIGNEDYTSELFSIVKSKKGNICFTFNWLNNGNSSQIYSISFFKNLETFFKGQGKSELTISTFGYSIVYFLPLISYIICTKDFNLDKNDATKLIKAIFKNGVKEGQEYPFYIGALKYRIMEGLTRESIRKTFMYNINNICESDFEDIINWRKKKLSELQDASSHKNDSPEAEKKYKDLWQEYEEIKTAIKGGATNVDEIKLSIDKNKTVEIKGVQGQDEVEKQINKSKKSPDQVFKEMEKYISMVIKGITPSVILCGAPGVGKTFRVKEVLRKAGYTEDHNLCTIKGKCTPRVLYMKLLEFKDKGDIIVIDDADGLVGPKAPEEVINILKAALDSTSDPEGRQVSYGVSGSLKDDEGIDLPKKFFYKGGVIVITNYNAGQLDTALRGRSFIQDIHFTVEEVLGIIKQLLPKLDPEHLSTSSKNKAYEFLNQLAKEKSQMEISIRTFIICAKIFEACGEDIDFDDEDAKSMIKEQMKLQADRGGQKY